MNRPSLSIGLVLVVLGVAACGGSGGPSPTVVSTPGASPIASADATMAPSAGATPLPPAPSASPVAGASVASKGTLTLLTHDSFALSDSVIAAFQQDSGYTLQVLRAGDAGAMVNQAILSKDHPLGDVLFGVDNTFLSRSLDAGIFEPYDSPAAGTIPQQFQLDLQHRVTPIDEGDVCPVLDSSRFAPPSTAASGSPTASGSSAASGTSGASGFPAAPKTLDDLADPAYRGMLVVENPATSSPGLAFLLATIAKYGDATTGGWLDYWTRLRQNAVLVSQSWDDAYDARFSAGPGAGDRPIVISYATDPAADVVFADPPKEAPSVSLMLDACFRQVEFAGVLAGAANPAGARAFIDFLLSPQAQQDIPLQMFVYPVVPGTVLPDAFQKWAQQAPDPLAVDPARIEQSREGWLDQWTTTVVR